MLIMDVYSAKSQGELSVVLALLQFYFYEVHTVAFLREWKYIVY